MGCGGDDPQLDGHFASCLNAKGVRGLVANNTFRRFVANNTLEQDHGLYAKVASELQIVNNVIAGWQTSPAGGAVKVDSCSEIQIHGNRFVNSGIQVYDNQKPTTKLRIS